MMSENLSINELDKISVYLPERIKLAVERIAPEYALLMEEIRINAGLPLIGVFNGYDRYINSCGLLTSSPFGALQATPDEVERLFYLLCEHSVYAYQDDIARGFITLKGGYRAGICGTVVYQGELVKSIKEISSICIRISRQLKGCAKKFLPYIIKGRQDIFNTLIVSPPRCGKTTILRDICRLISLGSPKDNFDGLRTSVIDERSEIAASYEGVAQNDCGPRTDVLDGCRKSEGIEMVLRGMSPSVIIVDEVGAKRDAESIKMAWNAGVRIIATVHAYDLDDLKGRLGIGFLINKSSFERYIVLGINEGKRWAKVMDAYGNELFFHDEDSGLSDGVRRVYGNWAEVFEQTQGEAACASKA